MAHSAPTSYSASGLRHYNVDYSVGSVGSNWKPDVMLIQALLNLLYFDNDGEFFTVDYGVHSFGRPSDIDRLEPDGIKGPLTQGLINLYQNRLAEILGTPADGRFDPTLMVGGHRKRGVGLMALNNSLLTSDEVNGTKHYAALLTDTKKYKPLLCNSLKHTQKTARQYQAEPVTVPATGGA